MFSDKCSVKHQPINWDWGRAKQYTSPRAWKWCNWGYGIQLHRVQWPSAQLCLSKATQGQKPTERQVAVDQGWLPFQRMILPDIGRLAMLCSCLLFITISITALSFHHNRAIHALVNHYAMCRACHATEPACARYPWSPFREIGTFADQLFPD